MKLSLRLSTIKKMVPFGDVADIGADHGKLIISLTNEGISNLSFAVENKIGPYKRLVNAVETSGLSSKICCSLSDGISKLPDNIKTVVLAGMGGELIVDILRNDFSMLHNVTTIITDSHCQTSNVREFLSKNGFYIDLEEIVEEKNIFYEIIRFKKGDSKSLSDLDIFFGPMLRKEKSPIFVKKVCNRIDNLLKLKNIKDLSSSKQAEIEGEISLLRSLL